MTPSFDSEHDASTTSLPPPPLPLTTAHLTSYFTPPLPPPPATAAAIAASYHQPQTAPRPMSSSQLSRRSSRSSIGPGSSRGQARVEKARSGSFASPRRIERRKTMTLGKKYFGLDDHYNAMLGSSGYAAHEADPADPTARPYSWHHPSGRPSSAAYMPSEAASLSATPSIYVSPDCNHSPLTLMHDPLPRQPAPPFRHSFSATTLVPSSDFGSVLPTNGQEYGHVSRPAGRYSTNSPYGLSRQHPVVFTSPFGHEHFTSQKQAANSAINPVIIPPSSHTQTSPTSCEPSDFLPIQHPTPTEQFSSLHLARSSPNLPPSPIISTVPATSEKVLVAVGLYESPDEPSARHASRHGHTGKGLILEESWQPLTGAMATLAEPTIPANPAPSELGSAPQTALPPTSRTGSSANQAVTTMQYGDHVQQGYHIGRDKTSWPAEVDRIDHSLALAGVNTASGWLEPSSLIHPLVRTATTTPKTMDSSTDFSTTSFFFDDDDPVPNIVHRPGRGNVMGDFGMRTGAAPPYTDMFLSAAHSLAPFQPAVVGYSWL